MVNHDPIHNPSHYAAGRKYETIEVIEDWDLSYRLGNSVKYISRAGRKDPAKTVEDLKKARWYLDREIEALEGARVPYSVTYEEILEDQAAAAAAGVAAAGVAAAAGASDAGAASAFTIVGASAGDRGAPPASSAAASPPSSAASPPLPSVAPAASPRPNPASELLLAAPAMRPRVLSTAEVLATARSSNSYAECKRSASTSPSAFTTCAAVKRPTKRLANLLSSASTTM